MRGPIWVGRSYVEKISPFARTRKCGHFSDSRSKPVYIQLRNNKLHLELGNVLKAHSRLVRSESFDDWHGRTNCEGLKEICLAWRLAPPKTLDCRQRRAKVERKLKTRHTLSLTTDFGFGAAPTKIWTIFGDRIPRKTPVLPPKNVESTLLFACSGHRSETLDHRHRRLSFFLYLFITVPLHSLKYNSQRKYHVKHRG